MHSDVSSYDPSAGSFDGTTLSIVGRSVSGYYCCFLLRIYIYHSRTAPDTYISWNLFRKYFSSPQLYP